MAQLGLQRPLSGKPHLEWTVCEHDNEWTAARQGRGSAAHSLVRPGRRGWWTALAAVLLAAVMGLGMWGWQTGQAGLAQVEQEVGAVVTAELWAAEQGRPDLVASLSPADTMTDLEQQIVREAAALQREVAPAGVHDTSAATLKVLDLGKGWAVVRVQLPAQGGQSYRQTRVYRQTEMGWTRTTPTAAYWGAPHRLETEHFVFHYYARDAEAVTAAATKLDALYPRLYAAYFPEPPGGPKVGVQVELEQLPGRLASHAQPEAPFVVASPAVYLAPETVSDADLLAQAVVLALGDDLVVQLLRHLSGREVYSQEEGRYARWAPLAQGVRLWQVWDQDLPLADWRVPVVQWTLGSAWSQPHVVVSELLPELCAWHNLWLPMPYALDIPVWCTSSRLDGELLEALRVQHPLPPYQLQQLAPLVSQPQPSTYGNFEIASLGASPHPAAVVVLATVVEYAAATYGSESVPVLLDSLSEHTSWESLVPAVFGVPAAAFEAGWQAFLGAEYEVALE